MEKKKPHGYISISKLINTTIDNEKAIYNLRTSCSIKTFSTARSPVYAVHVQFQRGQPSLCRVS